MDHNATEFARSLTQGAVNMRAQKKKGQSQSLQLSVALYTRYLLKRVALKMKTMI